MKHSSDSSDLSTKVALPKKKHGASADGWRHAVALCEKFASRPDQKADALLNHLTGDISSDDRRRCQRLFYGAVRHMRLINHLLDTLIARPPRPQLHAMLAIALAEWLENIAAGAVTPPITDEKNDDFEQPAINFFPGLEKDESLPKIVDFTVERVKKALSQGEGKLVNAVLRRVPPLLSEILVSGSLGLKTSHPDWLVRRWIAERGSAWTERELLLNQSAAEPWLCWRNPATQPPATWTPAPIDTLPTAIDTDAPLTSVTQLPRFFRLGEGAEWSTAANALASGQVYAQDPATWLAPALVDARPGEAILDLCAAPGGKTCHILNALGDDPAGLLIALDQPGLRIRQLDENLRNWSTDDSGPEVHLVEINLLDASPEELGAFQAVLLDAPCSNTGVIRRRPDIKLRLRPDDITGCAELQLRLLTKASEFVAEGGRLIYSTCSLESEENADVVEKFLEANPEWCVTASAESSPADTGFDGASVFRLERQL